MFFSFGSLQVSSQDFQDGMSPLWADFLKLYQSTNIQDSQAQVDQGEYDREEVDQNLETDEEIESQGKRNEENVQSLTEAFEDIEKGASAYRSIGLVLTELGRLEAASTALTKSLEPCQADEDQFATLVSLVALDEKRNQAGEDFDYKGFEYIDQALSLPRPRLTEEGKQLVQFALWIRGWCELVVDELAKLPHHWKKQWLFGLKRTSPLYSVILDASTCIDPVTGADSDSTLYLVRRKLSDIFEQFRAALYLEEKQALVKEMEGLPNRILLAYSPRTTYTTI